MKKQKIWFMITFLIVICMTYHVNATNYELGDVNQDGEVSIKDSQVIPMA